MYLELPYDLEPFQRLLAALDDEARENVKALPQFIEWFDHEPLQAFHGMTARQAVEQGRVSALATYLISTQLGFVG